MIANFDGIERAKGTLKVSTTVPWVELGIVDGQ